MMPSRTNIRKQTHGLEYTDVLVYDSWQVGESVTRNIVLKNLLFNAVRITPSTPKSQWFSLKSAPQTTLISAGTSLSVPVVFKPSEVSDYDDSLEIQTPEGKLTIALCARLPRPELAVPASVRVPTAVVGATATQTFSISNPGRLPVTFKMSVEPPFSLAPQCGELYPQDSCTITVAFSPEDARQHEKIISVKTDGSLDNVAPGLQEIKVAGRAMYAHMLVEGATQSATQGHYELPFGVLAPGKAVQRTVRLRNTSSVATALSFEHRFALQRPRFSLSPVPAVLPAGGAVEVVVTGRLESSSDALAEHFVFAVVGGNRVTVQCSAQATAPKITVGSRKLAFEGIALGVPATQTLALVNDSATPVEYQLHGGCGGVFVFSPAQGEIPAKGVVSVSVTCTLAHEGYYSRSVLLTATDCATQSIACTARSANFTPYSLILPEARGLEVPSARPTQGQLDIGGSMSSESHHDTAMHGGTPSKPLGRGATPSIRSVAQQESARIVEQAPRDPIALDTAAVDFGQCPFGSRRKVETISARTIVVANNTDGPVPCVWACPAGPFVISPAAAAVDAHSTQSFAVQFLPPLGDTAYYADLECFIGHCESTVPTHFVVAATGHTFATASAVNVAFDQSKLEFQPAHTGYSSARTLHLVNESSIAAQFSIDEADGVQCFPSFGIIPAKSKLLCGIQLLGQSEGPVEQSLQGRAGEASFALQLSGSAVYPKLAITSSSQSPTSASVVHFAPCSLGACATTRMLLQNASPITMVFDFQLPAAAVVSVTPAKGTIAAGAFVPLTFVHSPCDVGELEGFGLCTVADPAGDGACPSEQTVSFSVKGSCCDGLLTLGGSLDFEPVVLGRRAVNVVTLQNPGLVGVQYRISHDGGPSIQVHPAEGMLAARSRSTFEVTALPLFEETINFTLKYMVISAAITETTWHELGRGSVMGIRPKLSIVDASSAGVGRQRLWVSSGLASLDRQLSFSAVEGEEAAVQFIPGLVNTPDTEVKICVKNVGDCVADWSVLFPNDLLYQPEPWAQDTNPSEADAQQKRIMESKVFSIKPRSGSLAPGEVAELVLSHRHVAVNDDQLSVHFVVGERTVRVGLKGVTLPPGGHLHFGSAVHQLASVEVGSLTAPVQHYTLHNIGDADVTAAVSVQVERTDYAELECGLSSIFVPAGGSAVVPLRFQPLVAGPHVFRLVLAQQNKDEVAVTLQGEAIDPRDSKPLPPSAVFAGLAQPRLSALGQLLALSMELVDLGDIALFGIARQVIAVRNVSDQVVSFRWHTSNMGSALAVRPAQGSLQPGEARLCQFVLRGIDGTRVYDMDVVLESYSEDVHAAHAAAVEAANRDRDKAAAGFTLTDKGRTGRGRVGAYDAKGTSGSARVAMLSSAEFPAKVLSAGFNPTLTSSPSAAMQGDATFSSTTAGATVLSTSLRKGKQTLPVSDLDLRTSKYQALPPISIPQERTLRTPAPLAPPLRQYVTVRGRVHSPSELRALGADKFAQSFVDTSMARLLTAPASRLWASETEADAVEETLLSLIHSALHDVDLQAAIADVRKEPLPLFRQFAGYDGDAPAPAAPPTAFLPLVELLLDNTIANILAEAEAGEFNLTARTVTR